MRRIFTFSIFVVALLVTSFHSFAQTCTSPATFTPSITYDFSTGMQGFTSTDFTAGSNRLNSTDVSAGTTKVLTSPTFFQPASQPTVSWGFDLGGSANVTSYTVQAVYYNGSFQTVTLCSGGAISGNNLTFSATAPAQILGQNFQIRITYTISGSSNQNITVDNFSTSAQVAGTILPVKFSTLDARVSTSSVSLKWTVASEENMNGYEVERSTDGRNYSKIGFVGASGSNSYSFVDPRASSIAYYRIKSVDVNGRYAYSTVALIKAGKSLIVLKAFPSPFIKTLSIQHGTAVAGSLITISSEDGRLIKSIIPAVGTQQTDVDLSTAKAGMYLVRYKNADGEIETLKILKQQ